MKENCVECVHHDVFWGGSGCSLLNNMERCKFEPRKEPNHTKEDVDYKTLDKLIIM